MSVSETHLDNQNTAARVAREMKVLRQFVIDMIGIRDETELFWYVARHVVARLGFLDCVIYRLDSDAGQLVQMAAIGDKTPESDPSTILNRLTIPLGEGITGHVAASREPIIVEDLRQDPRYISDLMDARSEICVPLLDGDRVLGVIDSEHPVANWFGPAELETLKTVAALTTAQLKQCRLNHELDAARDALSAALDMSTRANQTQARFLSSASHELRTPLNAIVGFSRVLTGEGQIANQPEASLDYAENIRDAGESLTRIINDILDLSAIEGGRLKLVPEHLDVPMEIEQALPLLGQRDSDIEIKIEFDADDADLRAWCDIRHFRRMVINLVDNALKYSRTDKPIRIAVDREADALFVRVIDEGVGIEENVLAELFEPFQRDRQTSLQGVRGAGLGLALSRELARANGGDITATSCPGKGSEFTIILSRSIEVLQFQNKT